MGELINTGEAVSTIVSGSSGYLVQFMPIFVFVIGVALAFAVISGLMGAFFGKDLHDDDTGV